MLPMIGRVIFLFVICVLALAQWGCAGGDPAVAEDDILVITASPATITNFGDASVVTLILTHADGRPVPDGARILLVSDGGSLPSEVRTIDGRAEVSFFSDATLGTVTITAQSGQLGLDGSITTTVEVIDRNVEVGNLSLGMNPSNLSRRGGTLALSATVVDPAGEPLPDKVVVFSSQFGSLASNGAPLRSNDQGQVNDLLTLENLPLATTAVEVTATSAGVSATRNLTITSNESPVAVIQFSPENPSAGDTVFFNGSLSNDPDGSIVEYHWDFGEGSLASGREAQHRFSSARNHRVTLRVTDDQGASHAVGGVVAVGANQPPTGAFTFSPQDPRVGDVITFDGRGSADPDGAIAAWRWSMGNGIVREGPVVNFSYNSGRNYNVTLTVEDDQGSSASVTETLTVTGNQAPDAVIVATTTNARIGEILRFDGNSSSDADGSIQAWLWTFGNGTSATGAQSEVVYQQPGTYIVGLTVTDNDGAQGFVNQVVVVADNLLPRPSFSISPPNPLVGRAVIFDASDSNDEDGSIQSYTWHFGDGTSGNGPLVQHRYQAAADYTVSLGVVDDLGSRSTASQPITVALGSIPRAALRLSESTVPSSGGTLVLDASDSSDQEDGTNLTYQFRTIPANAAVLSHADPSTPIAIANLLPQPEGSRPVFEVRAIDGEGNEGIALAEVLVTATPQDAPTANFSLTPDQLSVHGGTVILDASATSDGDSSFEDLSFTFSAEVAGNLRVDFQDSSNRFLTSARVQARDGGIIGINDRVIFVLLVTDPTGLTGRTTGALTFVTGTDNDAPVANLTTDPGSFISAPAPGSFATVLLDGSASSDTEDGNPVSFSFDAFHSGGKDIAITQTPADPSIAIAELGGVRAGEIIVFTLTVTDTSGLSDKASVTLNIIP